MGRYSTLVLWLSLTVHARAQQVAPVQPLWVEQECAVRVHLYDYAQVPSPTLVLAQSEVTRIFREARVQIVWLNYLHLRSGSEGPSDCFQPFCPGDIAMRILSPEMENRFPLKSTALGFAWPASSIANVCYDRVTGLTAGADPPIHHVLAFVLAHELGHLLLPLTGHSPSGIMRAKWTLDELVTARSPYRLFTAQQSQLMRAHLLGGAVPSSSQRDLLLSVPAPAPAEHPWGSASRNQGGMRR